MRQRTLIFAMAVLLLTAVSMRHPTAEIRVLTHDASDPMPHQVKAALDLGLLGVSILYTWTARPIG
jgi:hypothetical protein